MTIKILIVDDAPSVREALRWTLENEKDWVVIGEASDGTVALDLATRLMPDVVILDVKLPGLDGYHVAQRLKALPHSPTIVFPSVHEDAISRQHARDAGGDAFVAKSEGAVILIKQIRDMLAG